MVDAFLPGIVEPTIFAQTKPSQNGSNRDFLELSWAKKLNLLLLKPSDP